MSEYNINDIIKALRYYQAYFYSEIDMDTLTDVIEEEDWKSYEQ